MGADRDPTGFRATSRWSGRVAVGVLLVGIVVLVIVPIVMALTD